MLRFLFRLLFTVMLFVLGRLLGARSAPRRGAPAGSDRAEGPSRARGPGGKAPSKLEIDRSDVLDVPFTEIQPPPSERAPDAAGQS